MNELRKEIENELDGQSQVFGIYIDIYPKL